MLALVLSAISAVLPLDVISTLPLEGDVTAKGGDYELVPFEVPKGTVEIRSSTPTTRRRTSSTSGCGTRTGNAAGAAA